MIKLYFKVLFLNYTYHFPVALFITLAAFWHVFTSTDSRMSIWYTHGWPSLILIALPLTATIVLLWWAWKHFKSIKPYYDKDGNKITK
jgi:magnesium-transporting ATPase (P-type)